MPIKADELLTRWEKGCGQVPEIRVNKQRYVGVPRVPPASTTLKPDPNGKGRGAVKYAYSLPVYGDQYARSPGKPMVSQKTGSRS